MTEWLKTEAAPKKKLNTYVIDVQIKVKAVDSDYAIEAVESAITGDYFANMPYFNFDKTDPNSPHAVELVDARVVDSSSNHVEVE